MEMLPSHAPSMRAKATRFAPASTTATFIGTPSFSARLTAASITTWAAARLTGGLTGSAMINLTGFRVGEFNAIGAPVMNWAGGPHL